MRVNCPVIVRQAIVLHFLLFKILSYWFRLSDRSIKTHATTAIWYNKQQCFNRQNQGGKSEAYIHDSFPLVENTSLTMGHYRARPSASGRQPASYGRRLYCISLTDRKWKIRKVIVMQLSLGMPKLMFRDSFIPKHLSADT